MWERVVTFLKRARSSNKKLEQNRDLSKSPTDTGLYFFLKFLDPRDWSFSKQDETIF